MWFQKLGDEREPRGRLLFAGAAVPGEWEIEARLLIRPNDDPQAEVDFHRGSQDRQSLWQRDGDHWTLAMTGTMGDGSTLLETNILRRIDDSTFTWQSIGRDLDNVWQ